ncbi:MAG TPA: acyl-CoA dehydrogenase family protein, partial [Burkholderiaceae bacterium]|nr:acyl-CoA dehydrogenase family protein [Burkholderiaceae bacterium]
QERAVQPARERQPARIAMDFDFSNEQKALRDEARKLLAAQCDLKRVRRILDANADADMDAGAEANAGANGQASAAANAADATPTELYDTALWQTMAKMGWLGAAIPEAYGGLGLGHGTLCVIAEEIGRTLAPVPSCSSLYLFAEAIALAGDETIKTEFLPRIAAGTMIGTLTATEGLAPISAPEQVTARFTDGFLSGTKLPVPDGVAADFAVVAAQAQTPDGRTVPGLFIVDLNGPGVQRVTIAGIDPTKPQARIVFDRAPARPLGRLEDGATLLQRVLDRAAVLLAFEQLGGADAALAMSVDYAGIRHAFGRPIGSFQAIKHKLADMYVGNELARANCYYAAWALDESPRDLPLAAAAARLAASTAYEYAATETIQTHGGIGATWEGDMHLFYRRARLTMLMLDSPATWRHRLVAELERGV